MNLKRSRIKCGILYILERRLQGAPCDVVLVADGVTFKAQKSVLCDCSSYFRALFTGIWRVVGEQEYGLPGVSPEVMRLITEYACTLYVPVYFDNVESALDADQLNVLGTVQRCSKFLEDQLCLGNCIGIYSIANLFCCPKLRRSALRFITKNLREVARTSGEFLELPLCQLCDIIEMDDLNVRREEVVFDAIIRWILHEPASRKAHISVLLPKVRMARMDKEFFVNRVTSDDVMASEEWRPIVSAVIKSMFDLDINVQAPSDFNNPLIHPHQE